MVPNPRAAFNTRPGRRGPPWTPWHNAAIPSHTKLKEMSLRRTFLGAVALAFVALVSGCKVSTINYFPPHPASVRVLNLMTDSTTVSVQVAGNAAYTNVAPETATGYQSFDNQTTSFAVFLNGSSTSSISFSVPLAGEQPYTLVVFGTIANPQATLLSEVANAPTNGNIQLSVFNAAINNAAVDIYVTAPGADITQLNPNYTYVALNGSSLNLAFAPGTYQIQVTQQGTKTVIFDSGGTALQPNIALALILYSRGSATLVNTAVLQSQGPTGFLTNIFARLKGVNAGDPAIGPVNELLGTLAVNTNIAYGTASNYYQGPAGNTTVNFEASATPGAIIASVPATLTAARDYSAFIVGSAGAQQAYLLQDMNNPPTSGGTVRLRFVNAMAGANPVNVSVAGTNQATAVAFPTASPYAQVTSAAAVPITFTDTATGATILAITPDLNVAQPGFATIPLTMTFYLVGSPSAPAVIITQDQ